MGEDDKKTGISSGVVQPLLIEVPVLDQTDLLELAAAIDDAQAAHVRLRSKTRTVMRKVQAALDRWSLPPNKDEPKEPALRLVGKGSKNRQP